MAERIGVIGAGAWGSAIAKVLAECGHDVSLWANEADVVESVNLSHENGRFLPGVTLPESLRADGDPLAVATAKDLIILAVPSPFLMKVVRRILSAPNIMEGESLIAVVTKGFIPSPKGPRLILDSLEDHLPGFYRGNTVYISGPSHAEEVSRGRLTGLVAACPNPRNAIRIRGLFKGSRLLVFPSLDTTGVQVCGATKNVVAIAFGMLDAIKEDSSQDEFGDNTESLLLAAGLNEMQSLGIAMGATHPETFSSLAGVGDLDVTCRSVHGRNRRFGREIVGKDLLAPFRDHDDLLARIGELGYLPEGAVAAKEVALLAEQLGLTLPIMGGVARILDKAIEPRAFLKDFLESLGAAIA
ncbi:MAG TPA: NAD(P)H-dependent glycerol-3-phosphate dehydrogenase [Rectinemataceae bacterium]|nr:NAD(P)H-dependent glycerol-3-phosphate dehydrogenase [Rectinemataceae bacterium]